MADIPITREEKYLAYLTGDYKADIPKPITRQERYLYELCLKGMGGEISPEEIQKAVNEYLEKNPVEPGATTEQAQQIEQNKTDIALLKKETGSLKEDLDNLNIANISSEYDILKSPSATTEIGAISGYDTTTKLPAINGTYIDQTVYKIPIPKTGSAVIDFDNNIVGSWGLAVYGDAKTENIGKVAFPFAKSVLLNNEYTKYGVTLNDERTKVTVVFSILYQYVGKNSYLWFDATNNANIKALAYGCIEFDWLTKSITADEVKTIVNDTLNRSVPSIEDVDILLPNDLCCVVGHEYNIYFDNIIKSVNSDIYRFKVRGIGTDVRNLGDRLRITPTSKQANKTIIIDVYLNNKLLKSHTITAHFIADNPPTIKLLRIGDSMTENGYTDAELKSMFGDNITLYGTRSSIKESANGTSVTVYNEGRSSWNTQEYRKSSSKNNVENKFYNPTADDFDFSYYIRNNTDFSDVTDVVIQLGTNDATGRVSKDNYATNIQYMADNIHTFNQNIRVYICIAPPNVKDGYAWGIRNFSDRLSMKNNLFDYGKALYESITNAVLIPTYLNLDCYNDFPKTKVALSARNPEEITVCNDNVHPTKYGFYKIADSIYNAILGKAN